MAFTPKDWKDSPDTSTPLSAAAIEDLETRVTDYTDSAAIAKALVDAKGDVIAGTAADTVARVAVGANGTYLRGNSAATPGVDWQTPFLSGTHAARLAASHIAGTLWKETDTGLVYLDDGSNWIIWKGDGHVRKTADETVNNSTTLQNDDHLFFPIEAGERWFAEAVLKLEGSSENADFQFDWTGPAGASFAWERYINQASFLGVTTGNNPNALSSSALTIGSRNGVQAIVLAGWFTAAGTAGTIRLRWAQNTATVENSKVLTDSFLRLTRLA